MAGLSCDSLIFDRCDVKAVKFDFWSAQGFVTVSLQLYNGGHEWGESQRRRRDASTNTPGIFGKNPRDSDVSDLANNDAVSPLRTKRDFLTSATFSDGLLDHAKKRFRIEERVSKTGNARDSFTWCLSLIQEREWWPLCLSRWKTPFRDFLNDNGRSKITHVISGKFKFRLINFNLSNCFD